MRHALHLVHIPDDTFELLRRRAVAADHHRKRDIALWKLEAIIQSDPNFILSRWRVRDPGHVLQRMVFALIDLGVTVDLQLAATGLAILRPYLGAAGAKDVDIEILTPVPSQRDVELAFGAVLAPRPLKRFIGIRPLLGLGPIGWRNFSAALSGRTVAVDDGHAKLGLLQGITQRAVLLAQFIEVSGRLQLAAIEQAVEQRQADRAGRQQRRENRKQQ